MAEIIRSVEDIDPADKLELRVLDPDTGELERYQTMVQEVSDEGIAVSMPVQGRVTVPLQESTSLVVSIWKGHADHRFKSLVLRRVKGHIPQLILSKPAAEEITRSPRRQFFRVETDIYARIHSPSSERKAPARPE